jgi:16S rRNA (guanine527-N7)-methyltransferase
VTVAERVEQLALERRLPKGASQQLLALLDQLASDRYAPSSITVPSRAVDVHLADSLSAVELAPVRAARRIADIGSGAGFPGLVLATALPRARVALIESAGRKCEYLSRACAAASIANASVVHSRAESWSDGLACHDLVTARAVGPLALLCEYAAPLLVVGGTLVAWKGALGDAERVDAEQAAAQLGLEPAGTVRTEPYAGSADHHLVMYAKVTDTPDRFPRRPGAARKRPLGQPR